MVTPPSHYHHVAGKRARTALCLERLQRLHNIGVNPKRQRGQGEKVTTISVGGPDRLAVFPARLRVHRKFTGSSQVGACGVSKILKLLRCKAGLERNRQRSWIITYHNDMLPFFAH
jgi:hypothetical protein